jgi:amidophosphoribosyltransferase
MDFPSPEELMANKFDQDVDRMAADIGVDSLKYLSAEGLVQTVLETNASGHTYCTACFTGKYPVPVHVEASKDANEY